MRVLITNGTLAGRTGTEILTLNLVKALKSLGHHPSVYSPQLGPVADEIRHLGVPVTDDITKISQKPDVIHGHHTIETATAALRFPGTPAIFVCHDFVAWHDSPPDLPNITHHYAISDGFLTRLTHEEGISAERCGVILNGINTDRFKPVTPLASRPRKVLVFAKNTPHIAPIQAACEQLGLACDTVGSAVQKLSSNPETLIQDYDLVFTSAMSAKECLAAGRAVISCDGRGLAGYVSSERYENWLRENFGLPTFTQPLTVENFIEEINRYDADDARKVTERIRKDANLKSWGRQYVEAYKLATKRFKAPPPAEVALSAARFVQKWSPVPNQNAWESERRQLRQQIEDHKQGLRPVALGQTIPVSNLNQIALAGFHQPEDWGGAWSAHPNVSIRLRPAAAFSKLTIQGMGYTPQDRAPYDVSIRINNTLVGKASFPQATTTVSFEFETISDPVIWIEFEGAAPLRPSDYGTPDNRALGFAFSSLTLD